MVLEVSEVEDKGAPALFLILVASGVTFKLVIESDWLGHDWTVSPGWGCVSYEVPTMRLRL